MSNNIRITCEYWAAEWTVKLFNIFSGRTWRFATLMDKTVDIFISRDLDSEILPREVSY